MTGAELFLAAAVLISLCVATGWMVGGMRRQPTSEIPATWWACPSCHSVNEGVAGPEERCYRCGRVPDPAATEQLDTAAEFEVIQQFGSSRKGGWDREVHWTEDEAPAGAPDSVAASDGTPGAEPDEAATAEATRDPDAQSSVGD